MNSTLIQMTLLMACGVGWRLLQPAGLSAEHTRTVLTSLVYYLLLPAMVVNVLWTADIGVKSLQYTLLGIGCVSSSMLCLWLIGKILKFDHARLGAILLAVFPNTTYLGLPVLEQAYGSWARSVVIQMDLFSVAPFLFTVGLMVVRRYGTEANSPQKSALSYLNAPPFWAAATAVVLNLNAIPCPDWLAGLLQKLAAGVVPLMIFSIGLALNWRSIKFANVPYVLPLVLIKLVLMPVAALFFAGYMTIDDAHKAAAVLDLSMPSMILGIVFCDRFRLDSGLYAMAVTVTTALSLVALPFWYDVIGTVLAYR